MEWLRFANLIEPALVVRSGVFINLANRHVRDAVLCGFDSEEERAKVCFDLVKFSLADDSCEHVEAVTAIRVDDVGMKTPVVVKSDRTAVIQGKSAKGSTFPISDHVILVDPVVDDRYFNQRKVYSHHFLQVSRRIC